MGAPVETSHPVWLTVVHDRLRVGAHDLHEVQLAGNLYGRPLGQGPVTVLVGGITSSPFALGGPDPDDPRHQAWWPGLRRPGLLDLSTHTVLCPALPGNGTTWRGLSEATAAGAARLPPLNWALWHGPTIPSDAVAAWQGARRRQLDLE